MAEAIKRRVKHSDFLTNLDKQLDKLIEGLSETLGYCDELDYLNSQYKWLGVEVSLKLVNRFARGELLSERFDELAVLAHEVASIDDIANDGFYEIVTDFTEKQREVAKLVDFDYEESCVEIPNGAEAVYYLANVNVNALPDAKALLAAVENGIGNSNSLIGKVKHVDSLLKNIVSKMPEQWKEDKLSSEKALRKYFNEGFLAIKNLSKASSKVTLLQEFEEQARKLRDEIENPVPPLPAPDPSGKSYELYVEGTDALDHVEKVWGQWLKYYNPDLVDDKLFTDDIKSRDEALYDALRNQRARIKRRTGKSLSEIIPPRQKRNPILVKKLSEEDKRKAFRIAKAVQRA